MSTRADFYCHNSLEIPLFLFLLLSRADFYGQPDVAPKGRPVITATIAHELP